MKHEVKLGQTDYTVLVRVLDDAGAPKTALTEASIDLAYARVETDNDVTTTDVTPAALTALTDAHTDWGFEEVSATDHPGLYRLDIADAVFASGAWSAVVSLVGAGLNPTSIEFVLVPVAPADGVNAHTVAGATPETSVSIADAVWDEAMVAASSVPGVTAAMRSAMSYMFALHRNKITQTATTQILYADNGSTAIATSTVSDDATTATRGEFA
jgi:hypothetical protein